MKFVGIDPAMRLNGLAVCVIDDKKVYFGRYKNLAAWIMDSLTWERDCAIVVEDSSLQNITFRKQANVKASNKISRNVGMNQGASRIAYEWIKENGYEGYNISPEQKGKKWKKEIFLKIFQSEGYKFEPNFKPAKISQDEIDCFTLALQAKNYQKHEKK